MKIRRTPLAVPLMIVVLGCAVTWGGTAETNQAGDLGPPQVELEKVASINLGPQPPITTDEKTKISGLIRNLANIENPYFGLSSTLSGNAFAPIASARKANSFMMIDQQIKESKDFEELVELGPKALPFLLAALDDSKPTKLVFRHDSSFGGMWFANELAGNPANRAEQKVLGATPKPALDLPEDNISSYTVKVGDVCFVIIGEIVGRSYQAARYQPSACTVIDSPTHDTNVAQEVRLIWSSPNPSQHLLNSLLLDFASRGVFNGRSLDGWDVGSTLQIGAAMRLLYYFPQETTNLIVARLRGLNVGKDDMEREATNGVRTTAFIKAVAWSKEPAIRATLQRIFQTTSDPDILVATAAAVEPLNAAATQKRLEEFIADLPETEPGPYGEGYKLLVALGQEFGAEVKPVFERYMEHASLQRRRSMCRVLEEVHGDWSVELLGPLLEDKRPAEGWTYPVIPGQNEPRLPIRVCDEAAETISKNFPKLKFKMAGEHADLDRQIRKMREQIARHEY